MKNFILFLNAVLVSVFLIPIGLVYNIGKSIYKVLKYWYYILFQLIVVFKYLSTRKGLNIWFKLAYTQDLLWNVIAGEFLEDIVTNRENTYFGKGNITVSASTGKEVFDKQLAKRGKWFTKMLDKRFKEPSHCLNAWMKWSKEYTSKDSWKKYKESIKK